MIISFSAKCSDLCFTEVIDNSGETIWEHDGYVPGGFQVGRFGDYLDVQIDTETGKLINFKPMTDAEVRAAIRHNREQA